NADTPTALESRAPSPVTVKTAPARPRGRPARGVVDTGGKRAGPEPKATGRGRRKGREGGIKEL
ncbi:MAG TPA: hypothetical protein VLH39_03760, partial [Magnetospirillaceae bacterium]|nr:hypothetical protein [Magnetospirillaceae bacterium]